MSKLISSSAISSDFSNSHPELFAQQISQSDAIAISNFRCYRINTVMGRLEQMHGMFDTQFLKMGSW
jgi:hypothetical protein